MRFFKIVSVFALWLNKKHSALRWVFSLFYDVPGKNNFRGVFFFFPIYVSSLNTHTYAYTHTKLLEKNVIPKSLVEHKPY